MTESLGQPQFEIPEKLAVLQRTAPMAPLVDGLRIVPALFFPALIFATSGGGAGAAGALLIALVLGCAIAYLVWYRKQWRLTPSSVQINEGLIGTTRRDIPFDRIQEVNVRQQVLYRALGLGEVRIDTAGSSGRSEARLGLKIDDARVLRNMLLRNAELAREVEADPNAPRAAAPIGADNFTQSVELPGDIAGVASDADEDVLVHLSPLRVAISGATGAQMFAVFAVMASAAGYFFETFGSASEDVADAAEDVANSVPTPFWALLVLVVVPIAVIAGVVTALLRDFDLVFALRNERLVMQRGLLERRDDSTTLGRIQAIEVYANPLRRMLGFYKVRIYTAGGRGDDKDHRGMSIEVLRRNEVDALLEKIGFTGVLDQKLTPLPARACRRLIIRSIILPLLIAAAFLKFFVGVSLGFLALTVIAIVLAVPAWHARGWARSGDLWIIQRGIVGRKRWVVPLRRAQSADRRMSPTQRLSKLATVGVDVAGQRRVEMPDIPVADAVVCSSWLGRVTAKGPE